MVSHDRYFMDKVVDHLMVFNGAGDIRDFPGNYTQYREWKESKARYEKEQQSKDQLALSEKRGKVRLNDKPRLTYKERMELRALDEEIPRLEEEKKKLEDLLCAGTSDAETITNTAKRLSVLNGTIEEKSMRWLELSEIEEAAQ